MARKAEVPVQAIIEAGKRLQASGRDVNGWSLRVACGGKGTPSRLYAVWLAHLATQEPAAPPTTLPQAMEGVVGLLQERFAADIRRILEEIYGHAELAAAARCQEAMAALRNDNARHRAELGTAEETLALLSDQVADLSVKLKNAQADAGKVNRDLAVATSENARLRLDLAQAETDAKEARETARVAEIEAAAAKAAAKASADQTLSLEDRLQKMTERAARLEATLGQAC
jgi:hypothetical protein